MKSVIAEAFKKKRTPNSPMYSLSCVQPLNIDLNFLFPPYKTSV